MPSGWRILLCFINLFHKLFVFESKSKDARVILREVVSFFGARLLSFVIFDFALFTLLNVTIGINSYICKIITGVLVVIFNYIASKLVIFKKKDSGNNESAE